jgi:septum formation protein
MHTTRLAVADRRLVRSPASFVRECIIAPVRLVLASASPRRSELLRAAGLAFDVVPADVDETALEGETPEAHVLRLARVKAERVAAGRPADVVLGADTVVAIDGLILGKPGDEADATAMLRRLSGRTHEVVTGVAVVAGAGMATSVDRTLVHFAQLSEEDLAWYVRSGEPLDKAGAYGIQGRASRFVDRIDGSYSNVVGLPVRLAVRLLEEVVPGGVEALA